MSPTHRSRILHRIGVILILVLAAYLRWGAFDEAIIRGDQSAILDAAFQVAHFRYFPDVGMKSSVGVMQTGVVPLLAAVPLIVVKRIVAVRWFFAALDFLALTWLYRGTRKALGRRVACLTLLLYATNPWVIEFARTIWYQTLIAAFATVAFAGCLWTLSAEKGRHAALSVTLVGATLMSTVHLAAAPWGLLLFAFGFFIAWKDQLWHGFGAGVGISGILTLPYLSYLVRTRFKDVAFLLQTGSEAAKGLNTASFRLAGELLSGSMIVATARGDQWDRAVIEWPREPLIFLFLLGFGAFFALTNTDRRHQNILGLAIVWSILVPTLFLIADVHLQHFYLMHIFPAPLFLIADGIDALLRKTRIGSRIVGYGMLALTLVISIWWSSLWDIRIRLEAKGQLQRTTRAWLMDQTAVTIKRYLDSTPNAQVIVLTEAEGDVTPFDWIRAYAQSDAVRVTWAGTGFIIPPGPVCYLLGPGVSKEALKPIADHVNHKPAMTINTDPPWSFHCADARGPMPTPTANWTNGLRLLKTEIDGTFAPNEILRLTYTWHYLPIRRRDYHIFNHLLLEGQTLIAQIDGAGVPTKYWRADDILITRFDLHLPDNLPKGSYHLLTGTYTWPEIERVFLTDGSPAYEVEHFVVP
jgi:hypothetical protein